MNPTPNPSASEAENPPAFPTHSVGKEPGTSHFQESDGGMSLRDFFAAKAMQGYITLNYEDCAMNDDRTAKWSYALADAMLRARKEQP
jgi:hypothetical protein